jgi:Rap1a immunity proteins
MRLRVLFIAAGLLWSSPSLSGVTTYTSFYDGNRLYVACRSSDHDLKFFCHGYVASISDSLGAQTADQDHVCMPDGVRASQVEDIVVKYLSDHPEVRHYSAWSLGASALRLAFPCKEQGR